MSYLDDASLVVIPSGYQDQKIFSVKPLDGSGDLTFTRASSATRVASNGLIEKVRTNTVLYSEQLNNSASWGFEQLAVTANAVANPLDGAVTADKIYATVTGASVPILKQSIGATANQTITVSGYFKKLEYDYVLIHGFGLGGTSFNLAAGTKSGTGTITSVGNGWYRCAAVLAMTADSRIFITPSVDGSVSYVSTANSGIYAFGVQVEINDIATAYIATTTAAVSVGPVSGLPRLDYLNSSCPRLLLEGQRTSNSQFSESFDNAYWTKTNVTLTSTLGGPIDQSKYFTITCDGTAGTFKGVGKSFLNDSANTYSLSVFAKAGNSSTFVVSSRATLTANDTRAIFNLSNGTITDSSGGTATITPYGDGWYRCTFIVVNAGTYTNEASFFFGHPHGAANGATLLATGAMSEVGAYATSYIPTLGASVTRVADAASKTGISSLIGQTEGTLFMEFNSFAASYPLSVLCSVTNGNASKRAYAEILGTTLTMGFIGSASNSATSTIASGTNKVAIAYKNGDIAFYHNGVLKGTGTANVDWAGGVDIFNTYGLYYFNPTYAYNEKEELKQALVFKTRLTNESLAELTSL
jgi:hypothetical protein